MQVALYRKYRPRTFSELVGQEHVVQTLKNAVQGNQVSHAYLFSGPRGCGKTTMARVLAKAVNCKSSKNGEPCNACASCEEIARGGAIDLIEIDAASNRGIQEIRDLKEAIKFAPSFLPYKVFVIDEAHQLTKDAANALLKILEEPPSHALFILATTELHKMIPTIASRCQRFDFRKLRVQEIAAQLENIAKQEEVKVEKHVLELLSKQSEGSLRDAIGLLDKILTFHTNPGIIGADEVQQLLGIVDTEVLFEFVNSLKEKKAAEAVAMLHENLEKGMDPHEFTKGLLQYLRHLLVASINPELASSLEEFTEEQRERLGKQAGEWKASEIARVTDAFLEAASQMRYAPIVQLPLELAIVDSCAADAS
ncbi:MAG: DNA polymerase III subunit gamma/tau [Patescibacteria group bacterium]